MHDYAHPEVQEHQLQQLADPTVVEQAAAAVAEIRNLDASSIGDVKLASITNFTTDSASILVETDQIFSNNLVGRGRKLSGTLDCELHPLADRGWTATSFQWLSRRPPLGDRGRTSLES